jgi:hypothetical protein
MAELDELLSATLKRVAEPGDPAGVADIIRSRVDAGDTGSPARRNEFGRRSNRARRWLGWLSVAVVLGIAVSVLVVPWVYATAFGALFGARESQTEVVQPRPAPSGTPSPGTASSTPSPSASPVPTSATPTPTAEPEPVPEAPAPVPPPPVDTTPPVLNQASISSTQFSANSPITISTLATDDVSVSSVLISWSGALNGSGTMSNVGGPQWQFGFASNAPPGGLVTFTLIAVDSAGNQSTPAQVQAFYV